MSFYSEYENGYNVNEMMEVYHSEPESEPEEKIRFCKIPLKCGVVVLMDHPASLTVYNYVSIQVLSGSVSVLGYEINSENNPLKVFSSENFGLIEVKTERFENIWKKKGNPSDLEERFREITGDGKKANSLLSDLGTATVAIFIQCCAFPASLQFLELYFPQSLEFNLSKTKGTRKVTKKQKLYIDDSVTTNVPTIPIRFNQDVEQLVSKINMKIRSTRLAETDAPRILVCGPRNTGKSSLIRYLINKILAGCPVTYYLDTDPGQTEFTPPGVVSLTKVNQPIIGPSFCHQRDPKLMVFTGSVSPSSPDMYSKSVSKLMNVYDDKYKGDPLFVNTMGWMEGFGLQCLINVISIVKPTVLVEIGTKEDTSMFDYREVVPKNTNYYQIRCSFEQKTSYFGAKDKRNLALLSYFGKCQSPFFGPMPLNEITPYCVSWDKIAVHICSQKVPPHRIIEAINQSVVALCAVPKHVILDSNVPEYPKTLEDEPDNECIGFGIVRAVDEMAHLLYIVTPLKMMDLQRVNAIIKGNIMVPDSVILNQNIYETPLPFTEERVIQPTEDQPQDVQDVCKLSLIDNDKNVDSPMSHGSADRYRRKVPKRYHR